MAVIRDIYEIVDRFSAPFKKAAELGNRAAKSLENVQQNITKTQKAADSALPSVGRLAGLLAGAVSVRAFVGISDELTSIQARLNAINDSFETTAELNDLIFQSAQRSRGSYMDIAANVASLRAQTGDTFANVAEAVRFAELLNKQFVLSGTSASGVASTMYNLTQALATGVLRGNDLQMILSNSPALIKRVADYMGITIGQLREIAADGKVTAATVKAAIMSAGDDIDAAFEKMPMTFGQAMQKVKNEGIRALQPLAEAFTNIVNSEGFDRIMSAISNGIVILGNVAQVVFRGIAAVVNFAADHLNMIISILAAVGIAFVAMQVRSVAAAAVHFAAWAAANLPLLATVAVIALVINHLISMGATFESIGNAVGRVMGFIYSVVDSLITAVYNATAGFFEFLANVWVNPINAMIHGFASACDTILEMIENVAAAIDALTGSNLSSAVTGFRDQIQAWAQEKAGDQTVTFERRKATDPNFAITYLGQKGGELGKKVDNLSVSLSDSFDKLDWGKFGDFGATGGTPDVGSVGKVKKVENVKLSDEDLKIYRDLAERKYMNRLELQTLAPNISVSIPESAAKNLTSEDIADKLKAMLIEQAAAHTAVSHAY
jgi:tape measure domain-containing protein